VNPALTAGLLLLTLLVVGEVAFRVGSKAALGASVQTQIGAVEAAVLGLLGLLLGFTFAMAASRFDVRTELVIDEANAIETAYLRTDLVAEPERSQMRELLRRYVDARLDFYNAGQDDARAAAQTLSERLQRQLWLLAAGEAKKDPHAITTGLLIQSMNQIIDLHAARINALVRRVPVRVIQTLMLVGVAAAGLVGYAFGLAKRRHASGMVILAVLVSTIVLVILDLDDPARGLIRVNQASILKLQADLRRHETP
jgi:hypothetical protein